VVEVERIDYEEFRPSRRAPAVRRLVWTLRVADGRHAGDVVRHETPVDENLVSLKRSLDAVGVVASGKWTFEYEDGGSLVTNPDVAGRLATLFVRNVRGFTRTRLAPVI
jgi:hypothetical protein